LTLIRVDAIGQLPHQEAGTVATLANYITRYSAVAELELVCRDEEVKLLEKVLPKPSAFERFEVEHGFPSIGLRVMLLNARRLEQPPTQPGYILLAMEDVTESRGQSRSVKKDG
jgi:hypothetical protein